MNGKLHREDGPAIEYPNGTKAWYLNGKHHREDGPAAEHPDGYKSWYLNDKRHREDGPAIEHPDGSKYWYINGEEITLSVKSEDSKVKALQELMKTQEILEI